MSAGMKNQSSERTSYERGKGKREKVGKKNGEEGGEGGY